MFVFIRDTPHVLKDVTQGRITHESVANKPFITDWVIVSCMDNKLYYKQIYFSVI